MGECEEAQDKSGQVDMIHIPFFVITHDFNSLVCLVLLYPPKGDLSLWISGYMTCLTGACFLFRIASPGVSSLPEYFVIPPGADLEKRFFAYRAW